MCIRDRIGGEERKRHIGKEANHEDRAYDVSYGFRYLLEQIVKRGGNEIYKMCIRDRSFYRIVFRRCGLFFNGLEINIHAVAFFETRQDLVLLSVFVKARPAGSNEMCIRDRLYIFYKLLWDCAPFCAKTPPNPPQIAQNRAPLGAETFEPPQNGVI